MSFNLHGNYNVFRTDLTMLKLVKSKVSHTCIKCDLVLPTGSYVFGGGYWRICINCATDYFKNAERSVKEFLETIKQTQKNLRENFEKYKINNSVARI